MIEALPFIASIVLYLVAPLLVAKAKRQVRAWTAQAQPYSPVRPEDIPDYLAPDQVDAYVEYSADLVQVVPAITLTGVGIVLAMPESISPAFAVCIMLGVVLAIVVAEAWMLGMPPFRFLRYKFLGISPVSGVGIVVNLIAVILVLLVIDTPAPRT
jgi:hypothetical protein